MNDIKQGSSLGKGEVESSILSNSTTSAPISNHCNINETAGSTGEFDPFGRHRSSGNPRQTEAEHGSSTRAKSVRPVRESFAPPPSLRNTGEGEGPLRLLDLFSGIGGFSLGLERSGAFETVAFSEINPFCRRVLAKHWPDVPILGDVTKLEFQEGMADAICGGFPCQDVSSAGRRAGLSGARSGLYREMVRAVRVVRPRVAVLENVAALLGRGMGTVLGDLAEIGYDAEWHCIPASALGAPHERDRIWIVADPGGEQHEVDRAPFSGALSTELLGSFADLESPDDWAYPSQSRERQEFEFGGCALAENVSDGDGDGDGGEGKFSGLADPQERPQSRERPDRSRDHGAGWWAVEPDVARVVYGVPDRSHRVEGLGNAVVPQIPEIIGRAIAATFAQRASA